MLAEQSKNDELVANQLRFDFQMRGEPAMNSVPTLKGRRTVAFSFPLPPCLHGRASGQLCIASEGGILLSSEVQLA